MSSFAVILPAAGSSTRFGGREKKTFTNLDGRAVWIRSAELFCTRDDVGQVLLVIAPDDREMFLSKYSANLMFMNVTLVDGGSERFESVANALAAVKPEIGYVAVHDAVRPCTPAKVIDDVFAMALKTGAALASIPVADTLKRVDQGLVTETIPRDALWQAQTPQAFRKDWLLEAYAKRAGLRAKITDDSQLVEALGNPVTVVPGSPFNLKITAPDDLKLAAQYLKLREADAPKRVARTFDDERFA
jgi:2-C-methyl-D-erythritol 4-phosphate cytidylyltransferase